MTPPPPPLPPWLVPAEMFIANAPPPPPPLIEGVVCLGETMLVVGPPGSLKTWALLDIIRAITTGTDAFGRFSTRCGWVVLVEPEHHAGSLAERLKTSGADRAKMLIAHRSGFKLDSGSWVNELIAWAQPIATPPAAIVLDTFAEQHGADENDAKAMGAVTASVRRLVTALPNTAVIVAHHSGKAAWRSGPSKANARGSSVLAQFFDVQCDLTPDDEAPYPTSTLTMVKRRDGPFIDPVELTLSKVNGRLALVGTSPPPSARQAQQHGINADDVVFAVSNATYTSRKSLAKHLGVRDDSLGTVLATLMREGRIIKPSGRGPYVLGTPNSGSAPGVAPSRSTPDSPLIGGAGSGVASGAAVNGSAGQ